MTESPYRAARLVFQAKLFTIAKASGAAIALGYQFLLVRNLSVPDYVSFTILTAANAILVFCTLFGMDRLVYRYMPPLREAGRWREMLIFLGGLLLLRLSTLTLLWFVIAYLCIGLLPQQLSTEILSLPWHYLGFGLAVASTDSLAMFCNSLGLQGRQAMLLLAMTVLRCLLSAWFIYGTDGLNAVEIGNILIGTEFLLAGALLISLALEIAPLSRNGKAAALDFGIAWRHVIVESLTTQLTYMMTLPFRGGLMKVMVGAVATPVVTASFGFFQTIADRAYQLMPIFMMKGFVEPTLASDYAKRADIGRVRLTISLLMRLNYVILMFALALLLGCGEQLINLATRDRYGAQTLVAGLLLLQLAGMTVGEGLLIGLNPIGRIVHHNRIWVWVSLLGYGALAVAAAVRSPEFLIFLSAAPYLIVYGWLRWGTKEALLQRGVGFEWFWQLWIPVGVAALVARGVLWLGAASPAVTIVAAIAATLCFLAILRRLRLISAAEADELGSLSPKLVRMLRTVTGKRDAKA